MDVLASISLPCSVGELETTLRIAGDKGHWHDAKVRVSEDLRTLEVYIPQPPPLKQGE